MPSSTPSSTPVTVTVCGSSQLLAVKVSMSVDTVPSSVALLLTPITTFAVGWVFNTTVNVAVPPDSVVVKPMVGVTVMPGVSLSFTVTIALGDAATV